MFENVHSPAVYVNRPSPAYTTTSTTLLRAADASAAPEWRRSLEGVDRHVARPPHPVGGPDAGIGQEGAGPAPGRAAVAPHDRIRAYDVGAITGRLLWVPGPTPVPWPALAAVLAAVTFATVFTRRWATLLAAALAVLVVNDVVQ